jgi:hypothetical protein
MGQFFFAKRPSSTLKATQHQRRAKTLKCEFAENGSQITVVSVVLNFLNQQSLETQVPDVSLIRAGRLNSCKIWKSDSIRRGSETNDKDHREKRFGWSAGRVEVLLTLGVKNNCEEI